MSSNRLFDILAPWYDRLLSVREPQVLVELLDLPITGWLLEVGGGTGRVAAGLQSSVSGLVVLDVSWGMLCQAGAKPGLLPVRGQSEQLPFPQASFDRVLMVDAFHHLEDQTQSAAELWRVLKPGGRLVIEEPDVGTWVVKGIALMEKALLMRSHFWPVDRLTEVFRRLGGHVVVHREGVIAYITVTRQE